MKRHSIPGLLLTAGVVGGLFFLFPPIWVGLLLALLALVTAQVVILRRNTSVVEKYPPLKEESKPAPRALTPEARAAATASGTASAASREPAGSTADADSGSAAGAGKASKSAPAAPKAAGGAAAPTDEPAAGTGTLPDGEVFSRFRAHLESMERPAASSAETAPSPVEGGAAQAADGSAEADGVLVQLSAAARAGTPGASGKPPATRRTRPPDPVADPGTGTESEDAVDTLFADLRPEHNRIAGAEGGPAAAAGSRAKTGAPPAAVTPPAQPPDEVQAALAAAEEPQAIGEEADSLLRLAREADEHGDLAGMRAGLEQYERLLSQHPELLTWEGERLRLRMSLLERPSESASGIYERMFARGYAPSEAELEPDLDDLLAGVPEESAAPLKVAFLLRALIPLRQRRDRPAMDRLYTRIEALQEPLGDARRMISHLKGHLTIREALGDVPGQLQLIDRLGKLHYELNDTAPAGEYYEMGVRLRARIAAEAEGAPEAVPAETPLPTESAPEPDEQPPLTEPPQPADPPAAGAESGQSGGPTTAEGPDPEEDSAPG